MAIKHYPSCTNNYPEKIKHEGFQQSQRMELEDLPEGKVEVLYQCVDCGAYELVSEVKL